MTVPGADGSGREPHGGGADPDPEEELVWEELPDEDIVWEEVADPAGGGANSPEEPDLDGDIAPPSPPSAPPRPPEPDPEIEEDDEPIAIDLDVELPGLSSPEDRTRIVAQALADVEMREARYRVPSAEPGGSEVLRAGIAGVFLLLAIVLTFGQPRLLTGPPRASASPSQELRAVRFDLQLEAMQVEAVRAAAHTIPRSLDGVSPGTGIRLIRSNARVFQLVGRGPRGEAVVYDAADPAPEFAPIRATLDSLRENP